jgi:hypothetical protein
MPRRPVQRRVVSNAPRREYVFSQQATIHDVVAHYQEKLRKELVTLQADGLLNRSVDQIVDDFVARYALNVPTLDKPAMAELPRQEIQLEVPRVSQNRVFAGPGPFFVPATLFTVRIPFSGDRNLFRYPASGFAGHIPAELGDDAVFLTYRAENPDAEAIKREFDNQISRIETSLEFVRGPAQEWNNRLVSQVRPQVEKRHAQAQQNHSIDLGYAKAPAPSPVPAAAPPKREALRYDVFLSHAWEDKDAIARPLYDALTAAGVSVWFDEAVLKLGDSLRRKIDDGLARCSYGIIIISPSFLNKEWPQRELDGLVSLEVQSGKTKILPIWHEIDKETLVRRSPTLADRVAGKSSEGIPALVQKVLAALR